LPDSALADTATRKPPHRFGEICQAAGCRLYFAVGATPCKCRPRSWQTAQIFPPRCCRHPHEIRFIFTQAVWFEFGICRT